jgi:hypothetical protein
MKYREEDEVTEDYGGGGNQRDAEMFAFMFDRCSQLDENDNIRIANALTAINMKNGYSSKEKENAVQEIISLLILV